ncbi:MAG: sulfite oxidase-like oxidoreductase [Leadbetterella sp.]
MDNTKLDKIVEARMKLMARFEKQISQSPSISDKLPQGSGPINRHGMPQVPVGQTTTEKWPVLDLGYHPEIPLDKWRLTIDGEVETPAILSWEDLVNLPKSTDTSDFHCVTTWSKLHMKWEGVRFQDIAALVGIKPTAKFVMCYGYDTYTTNLPLEEALKPDVLLAYTVDNKPLPLEHGGPLRMVTPQLYAWKGSKWIKRIRFMAENERGFWEQRGYSDTAYPWRNDRYS